MAWDLFWQIIILMLLTWVIVGTWITQAIRLWQVTRHDRRGG